MDLLASVSQLKPLDSVLQNRREKGAEFFRTHGLPTRQHQDWKYTSVNILKEAQYRSSLLSEEALTHESLRDLAGELSGDFDKAVFINGVLNKTLSNIESWPSEIKWSTEVRPGKSEPKDAFEALSDVYAGQAFSLKIPAEYSMERPFRLHFHTTSQEAKMVHPKIEVEIGERSSARLVESYSSDHSVGHFMNSQTEIRVKPNAKLTWIRLQEEGAKSIHIGKTQIHPGTQSQIVHLVVSTGAVLSRHELEMRVEEPAIHAQILGLTASARDQHLDNTTLIDHVVGGGTTVQTYKSLLDGESRTVFNGRIFIRPKAQKVDSAQRNNNLLMSPKAEADSQPQLMIEADDVKAAHGSTVGHLDEEELFYLQSRGLSRAKALPLLAYGFLAEGLDSIDDPLLVNWLGGRLKKTFARLHTENL